jgi:tRNA A-37 threonylcarbamoyl transferase component Bud32
VSPGLRLKNAGADGLSEARTLANVAAEGRPDLAKYHLLEELGHGGMATVYRAHDRRLEREVAVKVIHRHLRENTEVAARFTGEAKAVAKLRHPNIVDVYDVSDENEAERYLVVELVKGTTLRKLLADRGHLPSEIAAIIAIEVGEALAHAHEHGVIHRDVKPENVLVDLERSRPDPDRPKDQRSRIKLTDFGIAKLLDAQGVTSTGQVLGSPAHMSPEQIEGGPVTERSDVFGLGVLLYECLVGVLPFEGKNPAQVLRRVLDGSFTPADRARPTVGAGLGRIVGRALAHTPEERYPSISAMLGELREELRVVGFDEPRRELEEFLADGPAYVAAYERRVVNRLVELGRRARAERAVARAAACFNRALAYRPDDLELLRLVSGLAQAERLRRNLRAAAWLALLLTGVVAAGFGVVRWLAPTGRVAGPPEPRGLESAPVPALSAVATVAPSVAPPVLPSAAKTARQPSRRPNPSVFSGVKSTPRALERRPVKVVITGGAIGGYVLVDGARLSSGESRELQIGQRYSFEFRPPDDNADCCAITTKVVEITETTSVVEATVPFDPATIVARGAPPGTKLDCGMVGTGTTPSAMRVVFNNEPLIPVTCSLVPPEGSGLPPREKSASLTPGATVDLWP